MHGHQENDLTCFVLKFGFLVGRSQRANFVEGHRQYFNHVKIHTRELRGSVAFFLRQILTHYILSIESAITFDINTSQISLIYSATAVPMHKK